MKWIFALLLLSTITVCTWISLVPDSATPQAPRFGSGAQAHELENPVDGVRLKGDVSSSRSLAGMDQPSPPLPTSPEGPSKVILGIDEEVPADPEDWSARQWRIWTIRNQLATVEALVQQGDLSDREYLDLLAALTGVLHPSMDSILASLGQGEVVTGDTYLAPVPDDCIEMYVNDRRQVIHRSDFPQFAEFVDFKFAMETQTPLEGDSYDAAIFQSRLIHYWPSLVRAKAQEALAYLEVD